MDFTTFAGLPLHILLVHVMVVGGPLAALAVLLHAFWPAARRRLGVVTPLAGLVVLVLTPITVRAGEYLQSRIATTTPELAEHVIRGEGLLPWSVALFVVGLAEWLWWRFAVGGALDARLTPALRWGGTTLIWICAALIGVGFIVEIVLIGDSGARAVWGGIVG
ncbi:MAG: hypothetical protein FWD85_05920 [Microbacteriaceae bacterium]|nr:hypothetical protein [Microbacteriaceae bacterium]MCL2794828.1 hypothetical protein [Microbacteriaceae bacterium]